MDTGKLYRAMKASRQAGIVLAVTVEGGMVVNCDNRIVPPHRVEKMRRMWGNRRE